jgi:hypothetical protein
MELLVQDQMDSLLEMLSSMITISIAQQHLVLALIASIQLLLTLVQEQLELVTWNIIMLIEELDINFHTEVSS